MSSASVILEMHLDFVDQTMEEPEPILMSLKIFLITVVILVDGELIKHIYIVIR